MLRSFASLCIAALLHTAGAGKSNFSAAIYGGAVKHLGHRPSIKISHYSDSYEPGSSKKYAGMILYSKDDAYKWEHAGVYSGARRGQFGYVIIQDTSKWPAHAQSAVGKGLVHNYLFEQLTGTTYTTNTVCSGGFAVIDGETRYSSWWLNHHKSAPGYANAWSSDGSKHMSEAEKVLVDLAVEAWKTRGKNIVVAIPDEAELAVFKRGGGVPAHITVPTPRARPRSTTADPPRNIDNRTCNGGRCDGTRTPLDVHLLVVLALLSAIMFFTMHVVSFVAEHLANALSLGVRAAKAAARVLA